MSTSTILRNKKIGEYSVSFGANDAQYTTYVINNITQPDTQRESYLVSVENPSTQSSITARIYIKEAFNSVSRYCYLGSFTVNVSPDVYNPDTVNQVSCGSALVDSAMMGQGLYITIANNTALVAGTFTARCVIREM